MAEVSRILVVDDDPDIREVLRLLLSESYIVSEAPDGLAAVTYLKENPDTDLIVLDVMMPGMDGIETCARLREFSTAPVLFLTAKSAERDRVSAYESGGDDFLSKPLSQAELLAKISSLLRRYKQYRGKPASWSSPTRSMPFWNICCRNGAPSSPPRSSTRPCGAQDSSPARETP